MELRGKEVTEKKEESATLDGLPWDLVLHISRRLPDPRDRLSFRAVNRLLRSVIPSTRLTDSLKEEQASLSDPWLLSCCRKKDMDAAFTLIDPLHGDRYFMTLPGSGSGSDSDSGSGSGSGSDPTMVYCNGSWCVMVQATQFVFLWNPFTKEKIILPDFPHRWSSIAACALINSPGNDLHLKLCVFHETDDQPILLLYIDIFEHGEWSSDMAFLWRPGSGRKQAAQSFQTTLCLTHGYFWLLGNEKGPVWALGRRESWFSKMLWDGSAMQDYKKNYLVECGTDLLLVLTGIEEEEDVQVYKLGVSFWFPVDNLDDFVVYVSHFSSFSRRVTVPGEGNRIYLPRLHDGNKLVYYSLQSKRYHHHHCAGGGDPALTSSADGFQDQTLSAWIQPTWF